MSRRTFVHIALFISAFALDVRVKADGEVSLNLVQQPENCWATNETCAVRSSLHQPVSLDWNGATLRLDENTTLVRLANHDVRLIQGSIWYRGDAPLAIRSEFGKVELTPSSEAWIRKDQDEIVVSELAGRALLKPQGSADVLEVSPGFENHMGRVGRDGRAQTGVPVAIQLQTLLRQWAKTYKGSVKEFERDANRFYASWLAASEESASLHQELFTRKLASLENEERVAQENRRKVEARKRELIEMFRRHVFDE